MSAEKIISENTKVTADNGILREYFSAVNAGRIDSDGSVCDKMTVKSAIGEDEALKAAFKTYCENVKTLYGAVVAVLEYADRHNDTKGEKAQKTKYINFAEKCLNETMFHAINENARKEDIQRVIFSARDFIVDNNGYYRDGIARLSRFRSYIEKFFAIRVHCFDSYTAEQSEAARTYRNARIKYLKQVNYCEELASVDSEAALHEYCVKHGIDNTDAEKLSHVITDRLNTYTEYSERIPEQFARMTKAAEKIDVHVFDTLYTAPKDLFMRDYIVTMDADEAAS